MTDRCPETHSKNFVVTLQQPCNNIIFLSNYSQTTFLLQFSATSLVIMKEKHFPLEMMLRLRELHSFGKMKAVFYEVNFILSKTVDAR